MTSKEALKLAILEYEKDLETDKNNQWIKNVLKGLKECQQDLEMSEIFKKHISIRIESLNMGNVCIKNESIRYNGLDLDITNEEEYNKIKDWILK